MSEQRFPTPTWAQEVMEKYRSGVAHAFILCFNIHDYAVPGVSFTTYLAQMLAGRQIVAVYSRDLGITFPLETMREKFVELLGLGGEPQQEIDPALAALQSLGVAPAGGGTDLPRAPADALPLLGRLLRMGGPDDKLASVIVEDAQAIIPDADVAAMSPADRDVLVAVSRWGRDAEIVAAGNPVFLVTPNLSAINGAVRAASSKWEAVKVPLPGPEERLAFIEWYLELEERGDFERPDDLAPQNLANVTAGLSLVHLEDILLRAETEGELRPEMVRDRKEAIIRSEYGDVLEVMEPRFGFDGVGGLQHVKEFFTRSVIRPMREGRTRRCPMGVLMLGPSGTGKSVVAEAVACEAGINAVRLRIGGQIASKWQGEGERNLEKALAAIEGLEPCIVFTDEIDQAVSRGNGAGGSQQDRRIFQRLLEWMSDTSHRGKTVMLAASVGTDTPVLIEKNGKAELRPIGPFVDSFYSEGEEQVIKPAHGFRTLGFEDGSVRFVPFTGVYRHWVDAICEVTYDGGRLRLTGSHSVFILDEDRGVLAVPASSLRPGDYLVTFRGEVPALPEVRTWKVDDPRLQDVKTYENVLAAHRAGVTYEALAKRVGVSVTTITNWVKGRHKPRRIGGQWEQRVTIPNEVPVSPELAEIWGYFLAEGYARRSELNFCLGAHEVSLQEHIQELMRRVFDLEVSRINSPIESERILVYYSWDLAQAFIRSMGSTARTKHVPPEIWGAPLEARRSFIQAYLEGDGSMDKLHRWTATTVSKRIAHDLLWLLRCCNSGGRLEWATAPERVLRGRKIRATRFARIHIPVSHSLDEEPPKRKTPIAARCDRVPSTLLRTLYRQCRPRVGKKSEPLLVHGKTVSKERALARAEKIWKRRRWHSDFYVSFRELLLSPLGAAEVYSVTRPGITGEYVYDLVGCTGEAFFGGEQPVLLHNSNRPDLMDAALRRPGRFDKKIPFLIPDEDERRAIFAVMCRRYGLHAECIPDECIMATDGWTGAEIEAVTVKAAELVEDEDLESSEALIQAVQRIRPSTADIEFMTLLALKEVNDLDLLPPKYRGLLEDRQELEKKLEAARPTEARRGRREL
jgi:transitional endoplasmic reticulum ATPase